MAERPETGRNPPLAALQAIDAFGNPLAPAGLAKRAAPGARVEPGDIVALEFNIGYTDNEIYNPRSDRFDPVRLRSYRTEGGDPDAPFVAPTVELVPGQSFRLTLDNELPADDPSCGDHSQTNVPHCFNSTNMHTHGLWISPTGNSDNVLLTIRPGVKFTYEYNIPDDHPAGTFWYHPHLHGSTALQVASGMAGALIIRGDRSPTARSPGDLDILMQNPMGEPLAEQVVLFQQVPYACRNAAGGIKKNPNGTWRCDPGDTGVIESYSDNFGPGDWGKSGRYTSINGHVIPTFTGTDGRPFRAGEVSRWRLIHAGFRDSIRPIFVRSTDLTPQTAVASDYTALSGQEHARFLDANCDGAALPQFSLATDGLTREQVVEQADTLLQPGYREDLAMVFPEAGIYCLIDGAAKATENVSTIAKPRKLLGYIKVEPGADQGVDPRAALSATLIAAANEFVDADVRADVTDALQQGLRLDRFVWHASLMNAAVDGTQTLGFNIDVDATPTAFQVGNLDANGNLVDPQSYNPDRIDRNPVLGTVEEWDLRSFLGGHPFHIHVNPFQVIAVLDAKGNDVSGYEPGNTSPYARLRGTWKDTLFVTQEQISDTVTEGYRIKLRTRYQRYIGEFVLHCHILDHEDQGMMQNVKISLPGTVPVAD